MSDREDGLRKAEETMRRLQHEVRTPLGQIKGYSEMIEEELPDYGAEDLAPDLQKIRVAAERLLDLMDGKLQADAGAPALSQPKAESADGEEEAESAPSEQAGARLLVVDDDPNNRDILVRRLKKHGFQVDTAPDGIEGLRKIESGAFDLVVLDVMMPGMTGLEVLERVRRNRSMSELPIILATALDSSKDAVEGLELGANDYVTKPLDFPVVIARIETHLEAHRVARELAGLARQLEFRNTFIREALGRDVAEDLLVEMSERPDAVELAGEMRRITCLVVDIKGTRGLAKQLSPAEHHRVLNAVLTGLAEVVVHYEGTVDSMPGDSIVAIFGLPTAEEDDALRAVACGVAMQLELEESNARNARAQLPPVEIAVGIASGEVLAGGYGSGDKLRFKAIGEPIVLATAIERGSRGGEVWICDETARLVADVVQTDCTRTVRGESGDHETRRVLGVGGSHLISLREVPPPPVD
jgi:DNA-binding response OmpR family regulator